MLRNCDVVDTLPGTVTGAGLFFLHLGPPGLFTSVFFFVAGPLQAPCATLYNDTRQKAGIHLDTHTDTGTPRHAVRSAFFFCAVLRAW